MSKEQIALSQRDPYSMTGYSKQSARSQADSRRQSQEKQINRSVSYPTAPESERQEVQQN